jgi:hypothetical protein
MTIRGRVDVYCTDLPGPTFIAVASSTELNDSGRPAVVRIVEFQATEPLYKATQIGDFGDFEFRVTELHDEIVTLIQMQQRWDLVPADARWWPKYYAGMPTHMRGDLVYAALGPLTTIALIDELKRSALSGGVSNSLFELLQELEMCDGRRPKMLLALATALSATQRRPQYEIGSEIDFNPGIHLGDEVLKHLGSLFLGAIGQFGFDEQTFSNWFRSQRSIFLDDQSWPPPGLEYTLNRPGHDEPLIWRTERVDFPPFDIESEKKFNLWTVFDGLALQVDDALNEELSQVSRASIDTRAWARLTSATVQLWHQWLSGEGFQPRTPLDDDEFTFQLLSSISEIPSATWKSLTEARHICFVADLGELLMILRRFPSSDVAEQAIDALKNVCDNSLDLLNIARIAGLNLSYEHGRDQFVSDVDRIASRMN